MSVLGIDGADGDLAAVEAAVLARLGEPLTAATIARELGISERTLGRRLPARRGLAPSRYLRRVKLEAALRLPSRCDAPLDDIIAQSAGLANAAGRYRLFVRHIGRPPGSFRSGVHG